MPLGQLVCIVLALLAATGFGRHVLLQFGLSAATAAFLCAAAVLGSGFVWMVPMVPPVRLDLGSSVLLGAAFIAGFNSARRTGTGEAGRYWTALLATVVFALFIHEYLPQEPAAGALLDPRTGLLLASALVAAGLGRQPAVACSAAAAAYVAVLARDWVLLQRAGFVAIPLAVGGYAFDSLVFSLMTAAVSAAGLAVVASRPLPTFVVGSKGGEPG